MRRENFGMDHLSETVVSFSLCVQTVHSHLTHRLQAVGGMLEPDRISGSLFSRR